MPIVLNGRCVGRERWDGKVMGGVRVPSLEEDAVPSAPRPRTKRQLGETAEIIRGGDMTIAGAGTRQGRSG